MRLLFAIGIALMVVGVVLLVCLAYLWLKKPNDNAVTDAIAIEQIEQPMDEMDAFDGSQAAPDVQIEPAIVGKLSAVHGFNQVSLVDIPRQYTTKSEQVHRDTYQAMMDMIAAAKADGVHLTVVSAFRSYERQKQIWERKWGATSQDNVAKAGEILKWSSFPGISRHHWGTDIDFNSVNPSYWKEGEGKKVYAWMQANAARFGFCQVYDANRSAGYSEERWHWSHLPVANQYYQQISQPIVLQTALNQPVSGADAVRKLDIMIYVTSVAHCSVGAYVKPVGVKSSTQSASKTMPNQPLVAKAQGGTSSDTDYQVANETVPMQKVHEKPPLGPSPFVAADGTPIIPRFENDQGGVLISAPDE